MFVFTLAPQGSFHIGEPVGIERQRVLAHIPSDTIWAALFTTWMRDRRCREELLPRFSPSGPPPLTLTSAFPCLLSGNDKPRPTLRLYPRPLVRLNADPRRVEEMGKRVKASWVSERLFRRLCQGENIDDALQRECFAPGGLWFDPEDRKQLPFHLLDPEGHIRPLWAVEDLPRVALDRVTHAGNLYHIGHVTFARGVGLWFGVRADSDLEPYLHWALDALADAGLGGLRSTGHGAFRWGRAEEEDRPATESGHAVTLARYAPRNQEEVEAALQSPHAAYGLVTIGGWCVDDSEHAWRRRWVWMVAEGSVIGHSAGTPGWMVPVTPARPEDWDEAASPWPFGADRPVYRWGYAFPVPIASGALPEEVAHV